MFVRFRQTKHRLQASLIETRRIDGKVRHEHIASLGSVEVPLTVGSRLAFWQRLHERLAKLSNRIDAAMQSKILGAVHARIPMVTPDEQRALQLENAEADERFWAGQRDMDQANAENHKGLATAVGHAIADMQAAAADADTKAAIAKERSERIKRGEDVPGGLGKPFTREDLERELIKAGMTKADLRHCYLMYELHELVDEAGWKEVHREIIEAKDRAERATVRKLLVDKLVMQTVADDDQGHTIF
jgi:hypothetical protein